MAESMASTKQEYAKHFIALESNPELFSELIHSLGLPKRFSFHDVFSINQSELLSLVPRPVLALILILPTSPTYDNHVAEEEAAGKGRPQDGDVIWFKQTINNACGLYAILHAIANSIAKEHVEGKSIMSELLSSIKGKSIEGVAKVLENSKPLEEAYHVVAVQGDTSPPEHPEDEVDYHYLCFAKDANGERLFEFDGDRSGPLERGFLPQEEDLFSETALNVIRSYIQLVGGRNLGFSLMALAEELAE